MPIHLGFAHIDLTQNLFIGELGGNGLPAALEDHSSLAIVEQPGHLAVVASTFLFEPQRVKSAYCDTARVLGAARRKDSVAQLCRCITRECHGAEATDFVLVDQVGGAGREDACFTGAGTCKYGEMPRRGYCTRLKRIEIQGAACD